MVKHWDRLYGIEKDGDDKKMAQELLEWHDRSVAGSFHYISSWWEHRYERNVLFTFYEDYKYNLPQMIKCVADFVEICLSENELKRVTSYCTFDYMQRHQEKFRGDRIIEELAFCAEVEKWTPKISTVRQDGGQVGQGLKNIGAELKTAVDNL